jgi:NADP-reducing hydrogenase subunit HndD
MEVLDPKLLELRAKALYAIDSAKTLRKSHENPAVLKLYEEFLGEPGGQKAHELLHTNYSARLPRGIK